MIAHGGPASGMTRVAVGIADALAEAHDVHVVGAGAALRGRRWRAHGHDDVEDPLKRAAAAALAPRLRVDLVLAVGPADPEIVEAVKRRRPECRAAAYVPVDGPVHPLERAALSGFDLIVVPTEQARRHALDAGLPRARIRVIPHAVDGSAFHDLGRARDAKVRVAPDRTAAHDSVWILNANRNDPRKRLELTLRAFAHVRRRGHDAWLVLHTGRPPRRLHLGVRVAELGIADRVIFTSGEDEGDHPRWSDAALNELYNACEVGVNTSSREGWGLVAFEHALTGAAQVITDTPIHREIWGDAAVLAGEGATGAALERLVGDPAARRLQAGRARDRARGRDVDPASVGRSWRELTAREPTAGALACAS